MAPSPAAGYHPEADVQRLARYFVQRYGGDDQLLEARKVLDPEVSFDLPAFEQALRRWGVKVENLVELFAHIDVDFSGSISVEELLNVLSSPVEELQQRELQRQRLEVRRIFESLARSISATFGSIEDAFAKHGLHGTGSSLSLAQFGKLAKQLDIELESSVLQRVFREIDEDNTGSISVEELQKALQYHIVGFVFVEIASYLEAQGGIVEAFEGLQPPEIVVGLLPRGVAVPKVPAPPRLPLGEEGVSEEKFLRVLRQLKVLDQVSESAALMIHAALKPFTMEDFVRRLQEEHSVASETRQRQQEDLEKRAKERRRRLAEELRIDSRQRAEQEVKAWLQGAMEGHLEEAPEVTRKWALLARSGKSKTQLRDYVSVLEGLMESARSRSQDLQRQLEREGLPTGSLSLSQRPLALPAPKAPSPAASPTAPDDTAMLSEHRTRLCEQLLQAAAVGKPQAVQRCLLKRADINAVAWGGVTPLMCASRHGHLEVARLLLESSADPLRSDMLGRTALDHARHQPGHVTEWLRGHGIMGRQEFERMVQALGRELLVAQHELQRLEVMQTQIPSDDVRLRTKLIHRLGREVPGSPYPSPASGPQGTPLSLGRAVSFPVALSSPRVLLPPT